MRHFLLILAATLGSVHFAVAQTVDTLTVDQAVEIALAENLELRQAEQATAAREVALGEERLSLLPRVNFSPSASRRYGFSFDETAGRVTQTTTDFVGGRLSAGITLFDGFRRVASLKEAGRRVDAAEQSEQWTRQTVTHHTLRQFLQVVVAREVAQIRAADLEAQEQLLTEVKEFIEVGRRPESDLYQQQEILASSESQLLRARHDLRLARLELAQTLGRSSSEGLRFRAPAVDSTDLSPEDYDPEQLTRQALEQRSDIQSQRAAVEAAGQGVRAAKSTFWPSISMYGSYGSSYSSAAGAFGFDEQLDRNRGGSVGLSVSFPITGWLSGRQRVQRAEIARKSARLRASQAEQQAVRAVEEARLTYEYYGQQLEVSERRLASARTALEGAEERYRLGRATIVDLAEARRRYVEARSEQIQTQYQFLFQEKLLEYQTGTLSPTNNLRSLH